VSNLLLINDNKSLRFEETYMISLILNVDDLNRTKRDTDDHIIYSSIIL